MAGIIDAHAHLGDILYPNGGRIIEQKGIDLGLAFSLRTFLENLEGVEWRLYTRFEVALYKWKWLGAKLDDRLGMELMRKNLSATRENLRRQMDKYEVQNAVLLPVYPYVTFNDLHAAAQKDSSLIPFTGADFSDLDNIDAKFAKDVAAGAKGLKLHPILQRAKLDEPETMRVVEAFAPYDLPILFHSGFSDYYDEPEEFHLQKPEFGDVSHIVNLVKAFPNVKFIAGHAGLDEVWQLIPLLENFKNVWVDVSFQGYPAIRTLIDTFGPEKVMYGSDWPWGEMWPAMRQVKRATSHDPGLRRRLFHDNAAELLKL